MAARDHRKGALPFAFVPVPREVLRHADYLRLPDPAVRLMLDLMGQYTGKNNGRLCPSMAAMQSCGWTSKDKLARAKHALLNACFVIQTRMGHPPRTPEWLGFTWWKLDWQESMEVSARTWPWLNFALPAALSVPRQTDRWSPKTASTAPSGGAIELAADASSPRQTDRSTEVRAEKSIAPPDGDVLDVAISGTSPRPLSKTSAPRSTGGSAPRGAKAGLP